MRNLDLLQVIIWLMFGSLSLLLIGFDNEDPFKYSITFIGILIIVHGLISFNKHGGDFITPMSLFMMISVILGGIPSIYMNFFDTPYNSPFHLELGHYIASSFVLISQVIVYHLFGNENNSIRKTSMNLRRESINKPLYKWGLLFGIFIIAVGFMVSIINFRFDFFLDSGVYLGVIIIALALSHSGGEKFGIAKLLIVLSVFFIYYFFLFSGFGRINIATLLLGVVVAFNHRIIKMNLKLLITISILPALITASFMRGGSTDDLSGGLGSVMYPHYRFGQIVQLYNEGLIDLFYGKTIWAAIVTPFPRELWLDKPWNFNREITYIFRPHLVDVGHSEASVIYAEWFFNFGYFGLVFAIIFIGLLLKFLNKIYLNSIDSVNSWTIQDFIKFTIIIVISVGLFDLYWGGFSTFMARGGIRLLVLYILLLMMLIYLPTKNKIKNI